ncbi:hypothetical protein DWX08_12415 [Ruminococcus sp. AF18-22]|jgi:transcriptional regulator with XRE-family HTH domain|nr:hypothetical protein DWX08_12415 [Ruminococcus sp. AF18-22]
MRKEEGKSVGEKSTDELLKILRSKQNFDEYLREEPAFYTGKMEDELAELLTKKNLKKAEIIKRSGLDRTYGYQIFSGIRKPTRDKLLALGFGMGLTVEEMQRLLKVSEYPALYVKNKRDSIILFCLDKEVSLIETNELLYEMEEAVIE